LLYHYNNIIHTHTHDTTGPHSVFWFKNTSRHTSFGRVHNVIRRLITIPEPPQCTQYTHGRGILCKTVISCARKHWARTHTANMLGHIIMFSDDVHRRCPPLPRTEFRTRIHYYYYWLYYNIYYTLQYT